MSSNGGADTGAGILVLQEESAMLLPPSPGSTTIPARPSMSTLEPGTEDVQGTEGRENEMQRLSGRLRSRESLSETD